MTVKGLVVGAVRVKVKMRLDVPSSVTDAGETARVMDGESSLVIVPVTAPAVPMEYPGPETSVKATVSFDSTVESAVGSMVRMAVVEPAAKEMV